MHRSTIRTAILAGSAALLLAAGSGAAALAATEPSGRPAPQADADPQPLAAGPAAGQAMAANAPDHDEASDHVWDPAQAATITLTGTGATTNSGNVTVAGRVVTVTAPGTYEVRGALDGQLAVDTAVDGIVRLVLAGVTITNSTSSAINVVDADEVVIVLADGSTNQLSDATSYRYPDADTDEPDAALFSAADLTITGNGSLTVRGNAYDGIASKDGLVIRSGSLTVTAVDDGIRGKDYIVVEGGTTTVTATAGDAVKSTEDGDAALGYVAVSAGTLRLTAGGDAVSAETDVVVSGGDVTARSGGGAGARIGEDASAKGLKAGVLAVISEGRVSVDAADDGINTNDRVTIDGGTITVASGDDAVKADTEVAVAAGVVTVTRSFEAIESLRVLISGGTVDVTASDDAVNSVEEGIDEFANSANAFTRVTGGTVLINSAIDGIDTNGSVTFEGGTTVISGPASGSPGEGAIDANGPVNYNGGVVVGAGSTSMAVLSLPPTNRQGWAAPRLSTRQNAGAVVHLVSGGQPLLSYRSPKAFQELIFSSNRITNGQSYDVYVGGSVPAGSPGGAATGGSIAGASRVATVTAGQYSGGLIGGPGWPGWPPPGGTPTTPPTTPPGQNPTPPPAGTRSCTATYTVVSQWTGGFQGEVRVTAGSSAISAWQVTWTFPNGQTVTQSWNATVQASGSAVTARNAAHNGTLAAGSATTFGFIGSWTGSNAAPSVTCTAS